MFSKAFIAVLTLAAGAAGAVALTLPHTANAYDIGALPAPYTVSLMTDGTSANCVSFYVISHYDKSATIGFGPSRDGNFSDCNPQFQSQLDAFVAATINDPAPVTTTEPPPVTTDPVTTTDTTTTTPPAGGGDPAPTTTDQTTTAAPDVQAQINTLQTQVTALTARVGALEAANTAAWDAFSATLAAGGSTADAALAARSAGLNAIYQLG